MAVQFSEAWEFYVPDPEVAELFAEKQEEVDRAASTDRKKFLFRFEGNADMTSGRFFDGVFFGTSALAAPVFQWGIGNIYRDSSLVAAFEKTIKAVAQDDRAKWLARKVTEAWPVIPDRIREIMVAMVATEPPQRRFSGRGRNPGPMNIVAEMYDASRVTIYRTCLRGRIFLMRELIEPALVPKCACGCGKPAPIAYVDSKKYGHDVFEPVQFITGHNGRVPKVARPRRKVRIAANTADFAIEVIERFMNASRDNAEFQQKCAAAIEDIERSVGKSKPKVRAFP